jgi:hypothetical protein
METYNSKRTESTYKCYSLVTRWTPGTNSASHRIISYRLDFFIKILSYAKIHRPMNTRKHSLLRAISCNIHFLGQCPLMSRKHVMSDQQVTGNPCNIIPALCVSYYQTVTLCVQGETLNSWQPHIEMMRGLFWQGLLVSSRLKLYKGLLTIEIMVHAPILG